MKFRQTQSFILKNYFVVHVGGIRYSDKPDHPINGFIVQNDGVLPNYAEPFFYRGDSYRLSASTAI